MAASNPRVIYQHQFQKRRKPRKRRVAPKPELTVTQILAWADEFHRSAGRWPTRNFGRIPGSGGETWSAVNAVLESGHRGLPGGSSLARLLAEHRGVREHRAQPTITGSSTCGQALNGFAKTTLSLLLSAILLGSFAASAHAQPGDSDKPQAKAVTSGPKHHFFGYYDKCPWDKTGRYLLANEIGFINRQPEQGEELTVGMVDLKDGNKYIPFDTTTAWCWQQGTMLQWLGTAPDREVIYNSVARDKYVSIIRDVHGGKTRQLPLPIYDVSRDGKQAVSLDFARLGRLRPGYGYVALPERYQDDPAPKDLGVYWMDVATGENKLIVSLHQLSQFQPDKRFQGANHWVNHLLFNPGGTRVLFLHRWAKPGKGWETRLFTVNPDGTDLQLIVDTGMVSHFDWRDDHTILAWSRTKEKGDRFYLFDTRTKKAQVVGEGILTRDGHCSYSPDRQWILNDTYPDDKRMQTLMLVRAADTKRFDLERFYLPPFLKGPFRCDLHPRWNRDGTQICFDSGHEPTRQIYIMDVRPIVKRN
jgi:hypothetical protein